MASRYIFKFTAQFPFLTVIQRNERTRSAFSRFVESHTVREIIILLIPDTAIIKKNQAD